MLASALTVLYLSIMKPRTQGLWLIAVIISLLSQMPTSAIAGMTPAEVQSFDICRARADKGDSVAQFILGYYYESGKGVDMDDAQAAFWYRKAAEQGHAAAQAFFGVCCAHGSGVLKDEVMAVSWYRKAAMQNDAVGQFCLGLAYAQALGVRKDEAEAVKWYRKAAEQGFVNAQTYLGLAYSKGRGLSQNDVEAVKWFRKAADQGDLKALAMLGNAYNVGRGVTANQVEAYAYLLLSRNLDQETLENFPYIEGRMSPEGKLRGTQRAHELQKEIDTKKEALLKAKTAARLKPGEAEQKAAELKRTQKGA